MPSQLEKTIVERVIEDRPQFHERSDGSAVSWAVNPDVLRFIYETVKPDMATLETGSGHSTVAFVLAGARHIAVTPSENEPKRILEYCASIGIEPTVRFLTGCSDIVLPCSDAIPQELDFVFIDGAHYFPIACIDFHYTAPRLKVGGIMGVDDILMPSVRILYDFLRKEDDWELVRQITDTAFYRLLRKTDSAANDPWISQGINKDFWQRKFKREHSRLRWAIRQPFRMIKDPKGYFGSRD